MTRPSTDPEGDRISSVASRLGIPIPTIRSWERRYGFPAPDRTEGRHRRYSAEQIAQVRAVRDRITRGERARDAIATVRAHPPAADGLAPEVDAFVSAALALDVGALHDLLRRSVLRLGRERAIADVALPGMRELGARWATGTAEIASEHAATEVVRSWLSAIDGALPFRSTILLACVAGERHTVGMEAFAAILRGRGSATLLLGPDTPTPEIVAATRRVGPVATVLVAHRAVARRTAIAALSEVAAIPGARPWYAGNAFAVARSRLGVPGTYLGEDLLEAAAIVAGSS